MTTKEIIALVIENIQDESYTEDDILSYINKGCGEIAAVIPLPNLSKFGNVTCLAGKNSVDLPKDFFRHVMHAINTTASKEAVVLHSVADLFSKFPTMDLSGSVLTVAVHGNVLYYQGIPASDEVLSLFYTYAPKTLGKADTPTFLPTHLHYDLLYNYACSEAWNLIEDGIDGTKVNANKFASRFQLATIKLEEFVGVPPRKPNFIVSDDDVEDFV